MGSVHGDAVTEEYTIRVPLNMVQLTEQNGSVWPMEFDWHNDEGERVRVRLEDVKPPIPLAEQKSGTVGDCYECVIDGQVDYLYYSKLVPRKWFKLLPVTKEEYDAFYGRPDEPFDREVRKRFIYR
jgi:hypothetical protein